MKVVILLPDEYWVMGPSRERQFGRGQGDVDIIHYPAGRGGMRYDLVIILHRVDLTPSQIEWVEQTLHCVSHNGWIIYEKIEWDLSPEELSARSNTRLREIYNILDGLKEPKE